MDINNDGIDDIVSGSYNSGRLYYFEGLSNGKFAKSVTLKNDKNEDICFGGCSAPIFVDFDEDGDKDLIIASRKECYYIENIGHDSSTVYSSNHIDLDLPKIGRQNPYHFVWTDWDKDGYKDLVASNEYGDIAVLRYTGNKKDGLPVFSDPNFLIKIGDNNPLPEKGNAPKVHGSRSKIFIYDYNKDGKDDLVIGDFYAQIKMRPPLTEKQILRKKKLEPEFKRLKEIYDEVKRNKYAIIRKCKIEARKKAEGKTLNTKDWEKIHKRSLSLIPKELKERLNIAKKNYLSVSKKMKEFREYDRFTHGNVWVYLRK